MPGFMFLKLRGFLFALIRRIRTAGVETAAARRIHGAWNIALQDNSLPRAADLRVRHGNSGKQGLGVGMDGMAV